MTRPNILWICTDQQRWDTLSGLGFAGARTPHLDRLADEGVAFTRAYTQSPICTPSRASFLTGMYPIAHQVQRNGNVGFPSHLKLVPRVFQEAGYRTGLIGKLHLSAAQDMIEQRPPEDGYDEFYWSQHPGPDWPDGHDYQDWLEERGVDIRKAYTPSNDIVSHPVDAEHSQVAWALDRALGFMNRAADDRPWLLSINLYDPHPPFDPPKEWYDRFDPAEMPPPIFAPSDLEHHKKLSGVDQQTQRPVDPTLAPVEPAGKISHDTPPDHYDVGRIRAAYAAMVAQIDDMVGRLVAWLDETGQRKDTLILFMSDHGEMLGDHGLLYKGCRFYEGLVHVPMIASMPGRVREGLRSDALVELVDLPATLCEAASLTPPAQNQGLSLWPLLTGATDAAHHKDFVLSEYYDALRSPGFVGSRGSMYFDGRYKIAIYHDQGTGELFDLDIDPDELNDLWDDPDHATLRADLVLKHFSAMMMVSGAGPERIADY
ncbi:sulfatase family protein [Rhodobium gokarnense]|uniref:Arylsulfatase A-like enzyme n=1 Tax=Rhodobium gokarnense TaxID=364296 RepID=A0ABT3HG77_9HYPH|nr:sulfatase-like hydrolase/transferase [Rhodobium gokarnense]MCW2309399.1 arylsulfatase A-like enzyme [Rhodobium gokarnense]